MTSNTHYNVHFSEHTFNDVIDNISDLLPNSAILPTITYILYYPTQDYIPDDDEEPLRRDENINVRVESVSSNTCLNKACPVCLVDFNNEDVVTTGCNHGFHHKCIKEWSFYKQECPLCKHKMTIL